MRSPVIGTTPPFLFGILACLFSPIFAENSRGIAVRPKTPDMKTVIGDNWLLLVGINNYKHFDNLKAPINDVKALKKVLYEKYWYHPEHTIELLDEQATRRNIKRALVQLMDVLQPHDTILVYYAGHGNYARNNVGFWLPHDAGKDPIDQENWLSTADLKGYMSSFKCRHVLLVADSCFSGDLLQNFRSTERPEIHNEYYRNAYGRKSRVVITSGGLEEVPDLEIGQHSAFAYHLIGELEANREDWLGTLKLYANFAPGLTRSTPYLGVLKDSGHQDGGSYVFFRRPTPGPDIDKHYQEARQLEAKANTVEKLREAMTQYQRYLAVLPQEQFPFEFQRAREAQERIEKAIRGISAVKEGDSSSAKSSLQQAIMKYDGLPEMSSTKQIQQWEDFRLAAQAIEHEKYDDASRIIEQLMRQRQSEEVAGFAKDLQSVLWATQLYSKEKKTIAEGAALDARARDLQLALRILNQATADARWPAKLRAKTVERLKSFQAQTFKQARDLLAEATNFENRGFFDAEGALGHYESAKALGQMLHVAGFITEAKAIDTPATLGEARARENEAFLRDGLNAQSVSGVRIWLQKSPDNPAKAYWEQTLEKFDLMVGIHGGYKGADAYDEWKKSADSLDSIERWFDGHKLPLNYPGSFKRANQLLLATLRQGIESCEEIENLEFELPVVQEDFKEHYQKLITGFPKTQLSTKPLVDSMKKLRKKILEAALALEFSDGLNDAQQAVRTYSLMPPKQSFEGKENVQELVDATAATDRVTQAMNVQKEVHAGAGADVAEYIQKRMAKLYPQRTPGWVQVLQKNAQAHEDLIQETRLALAAMVEKDTPQNRKKLMGAWKLLSRHKPDAANWSAYDLTRIGVAWRDLCLAVFYGLYRNYQLGGGEYMFVSDQNNFRSPMVWVAANEGGEAPGFFVDKHEVTIGQFAEFWKEIREGKPGFRSWESQLEDVARHLEKVDEKAAFPDDWPMVMVTYQDAVDFAEWSNLRQSLAKTKANRALPTTLEWNRAAFAAMGEAEDRLFPWGGEWKNVTNTSGKDAAGRPFDPWTKAVPSALLSADRSSWGALAMGGNVSEWVTARPLAVKQVNLGGNFESSTDRASSAFRSSRQNVEVREGTVGFRCILRLPIKWDTVD